MDAPRNIVGPQVMQLRNHRDWSQEKLATVCQLRGWDISRGVVVRIEDDVRWIADFELLDLAAALKVAVQDLYPKANQPSFTVRSKSDSRKNDVE